MEEWNFFFWIYSKSSLLCLVAPNCLPFALLSFFLCSFRFYLIAGGVPLIICGITAAVNVNNYGDNSP